MYCSREYQLTSRFDQQYEKSTSNYLFIYFQFWDGVQNSVPKGVAGGQWAKFCGDPPDPSYQEYITAIELACQSLNTNETEDHMALRHSHPPKSNMSKEEWKALKQLKTDKDHIVLTAGKGVALVVMDRQKYIKKPWPFWKTPILIGPFQQIPLTSTRID